MCESVFGIHDRRTWLTTNDLRVFRAEYLQSRHWSYRKQPCVLQQIWHISLELLMRSIEREHVEDSIRKPLSERMKKIVLLADQRVSIRSSVIAAFGSLELKREYPRRRI